MQANNKSEETHRLCQLARARNRDKRQNTDVTDSASVSISTISCFIRPSREGGGGKVFLTFPSFLSPLFPPCPERPDSQATDFTSSHKCCFCLRCPSCTRTPRSLVSSLILLFFSSLQPHPLCSLLTLNQQGCVISKLGRFTKLEHFEDGFVLSKFSPFTFHSTRHVQAFEMFPRAFVFNLFMVTYQSVKLSANMFCDLSGHLERTLF